ncbi:MAG TPA: ATP-binding protein [Acidimicrobiales bacterium]|nr:ATP-binding protein [Acidimicrobiales bacterium]
MTLTAHAWEFQPDPASSGAARRLVAGALESWDLDWAAPSATLLVSELATNAVLHARTPFEVRLLVRDDVVRIEVHDGNRRSPMLRNFSNEATSGRGLRLIQSLGDGWGVETDADGGGKTVWVELSPAGGPGDPLFDLDSVEDW